MPRYTVVTPARNESRNLVRLSECLAQQTQPPEEWIVVDDGSTDDTRDVVLRFSRGHRWARMIDSPYANANDALALGRVSGRDVTAFKAGVAAMSQAVEIAVKVDADVSFDADFFARLLREFDADPRLGIASGTCYELEKGGWKQRHVTGSHVWGATRAYRLTCLDDVGPLVERLGWDGLDGFKAQARGWATRTIGDLPFHHHRPEGEREGSSARAWRIRGAAAHYLGYRPSYLVLRALRHAPREPAALAMIGGFAAALLRRGERAQDEEARAFVRRQQSIKQLPRRLFETAGRRSR
jgi:hypothetical protein